MKKILALAVGMLLIPFTAFGMEAMSDGDMDSITGQSGVAISLSNIQIYSDGGADLWYETSVSATGNTQAVGLLTGDTESFTFINAIADPSELFAGVDETSGVLNADLSGSNMMLRGDYSGVSNIFDDGSSSADNAIADYGVRQEAAVLSIRVVDNENSVFKDKESTDADTHFAAVEIGLPTLEIFNPSGSVDAMQIVLYGDYTEANPIAAWDGLSGDEGYTHSLGTIYTGGESTTAILGGEVGITSYGQIAEANKTAGFK